MHLYNANTYAKLGFDLILKETAQRAVSEDAQAAILDLSPIADIPTLMRDLHRVREMKDLLQFDDAFPFNGFSSVGYILSKASVEENWLNLDELNRFYKWIVVVKAVKQYIDKRKEKYPELTTLLGEIAFADGVVYAIERVLDPYGNLKDNATPELASIRRNMKDISIELRTVLNKLLRQANENGWSVDKEITLRNDRLVIPVKADAKGRIPGFIQDISQSGNTVFVEPVESLAMNNRLREYQILEQNEIVKILKDITSSIRLHVHAFLHFKDVMTEMDILRAKALLAQQLDANLPTINNAQPHIHIKNGFYPLLKLKSKTQGTVVVPLNVELTHRKRIIIISGPNAGGKSVALKTVGLLQVMLQTGFLLPVDERSVFSFFESLFIDLGDEQSVENDLSTYTSHLFRMRQMGDNMNAQSLFLIDEFGGGTDPKLGGAIAESFLERFIRQQSLGIITTHYGNLKEYAQTHEGVANAAMEFDTEELKPTYRLLMGVPGRSYAFEIAERVGVHRTIVQRAKKKLGSETVYTEEFIQDLERKNIELSKILEENEKKKADLATLTEKYEALRLELKYNKQKILNDAKAEAKKLIENANRKIEQTIRQIKEAQAEKELTRKLRKELEESIPEVEIVAGKDNKDQNGLVLLPDEVPVLGDWVKLKHANSYGKLEELNGNKAYVLINEVRTSVKAEQLVKIVPPQGVEIPKSKPKVMKTVDLKTVNSQIEVLGMRVEEALPLIEKRIDDALWAGLKTISILHGKGTGTLRDAIRKHLRDLNVVLRMYDAPEAQGGSGWTICELRG